MPLGQQRAQPLDGDARPVLAPEDLAVDGRGRAAAHDRVEVAVVARAVSARGLRVVQQRVPRLAEQLLAPKARKAAGRRVHEGDAPVAVEPADALADGVEDELVLAADRVE